MGKVVLFICDQCKKETRVASQEQAHAALPFQVKRLAHTKSLPPNESGEQVAALDVELCSASCVALWAHDVSKGEGA